MRAQSRNEQLNSKFYQISEKKKEDSINKLEKYRKYEQEKEGSLRSTYRYMYNMWINYKRDNAAKADLMSNKKASEDMSRKEKA